MSVNFIAFPSIAVSVGHTSTCCKHLAGDEFCPPHISNSPDHRVPGPALLSKVTEYSNAASSMSHKRTNGWLVVFCSKVNQQVAENTFRSLGYTLLTITSLRTNNEMGQHIFNTEAHVTEQTHA